MSAADTLNFVNQTIGSFTEQANQAIGTGILATQIPKQADEVRAFADDWANREDNIWADPIRNIRNNRNEFDNAFGDVNYWTSKADERAGYARDAASTATGAYEDAKAYSNEVRRNNADAYKAFNEAKAEGLKDLSQQTVYTMESINQGNEALVQEAGRKRAEQLYGSGFEPDDIAIQEANTALRAEYARSLGDQQKQVRMAYAEQRRAMHENFAGMRIQLDAVTSQALNAAELQEQEAAKFATDSQFKAGQEVQVAYQDAMSSFEQVTSALNTMDILASDIEQSIETRRQDLYLKAEELETMGITAVAGALLNWNISVPQLRPKAEGGGGGSDPSFSFGLSDPTGTVSAGATV